MFSTKIQQELSVAQWQRCNRDQTELPSLEITHKMFRMIKVDKAERINELQWVQSSTQAIGNNCFFVTYAIVLVIAVILIPRQLFAVPIFSWLNTLGLNDSLFGIMLPGIITGLGVIYFTQVFRKVPEEYIQVARTCGASEFRIFLMLLSLIWYQ